VKHLSENLTAD
jgi:hypothetical protein